MSMEHKGIIVAVPHLCRSMAVPRYLIICVVCTSVLNRKNKGVSRQAITNLSIMGQIAANGVFVDALEGLYPHNKR